MNRLLLKTLRVLLILAVLSASMTAVSQADTKSYQRTFEKYSMPDVTLVNQNGSKVRLKSLLNDSDKTVVVDFIFGTCTTICPVLSAGYANLQAKLPAGGPKIHLVSISIDPEKDTPEVLKLYAERFKATDRWLFLTGAKTDIYTLARDGFKLPIAEPATPGAQIIHSTRLILIDRTGTVRGFYEATGDTGVRDLVRDIRKLLEKKP